ncbi:hypothetical protein [Actinomycetospora sp. CA-084318]|uniref:hypothetical protein n=1 Tax=Actinomycetospora sp. CA-084318 TaxID=3239892 RepID=UPI003D959645
MIINIVPDIVAAAGPAARSVRLPAASVDELARSVGTSSRDITDVAQGATPVRPPWLTSLRQANERTQGPVRDAVVEAACDSLTEGTVDQTLADALEERGLGGLTGLPRFGLFVDTVTLAQQLEAAYRSPDPAERSTVALVCWAAKASG